MKRHRAVLFTSIILGGLGVGTSARADDWTSYQHDSAHTGYSSAVIDPTNLTAAWSTPAGYNNPLIFNGCLYADSATAVTAFNLATGSVVWSTPIAGGGAMAIANGTLVATSYVIPTSKALVVMNAATGANQYSIPFGVTTYSPGTPVLYTSGSTLNVLDVDQSTNVYSFKLGASSATLNWYNAVGNAADTPPTIVGNTALINGVSVNLSNGSTYGFGASAPDGGIIYDASRSQFYLVQGTGNPRAYNLAAFKYNSATSITPLWTTPVAAQGIDPALDASGNIYVPGYDAITEVNPSNGATLRSVTTTTFTGTSAQLTSKYLFEQTAGHEEVFNLSDLSVETTFGIAPGPANTTYRSTSAISDGYFAQQSQGENATGDVITVYADPAAVPEPGSLSLLALCSAALSRRGRVSGI